MSTLDEQFANLIARARVNPYFDFERALCLVMDAWIERAVETQKSIENISGSFARKPLSVAKTFAWPSEELCACIRKTEKDHLFFVNRKNQSMESILSTEPILRSMEQGDRIVVLTDWTAEHVSKEDLEQILFGRSEETSEVLENEIRLRAQVNTRGNRSVSSNDFAVFVVAP